MSTLDFVQKDVDTLCGAMSSCSSTTVGDEVIECEMEPDADPGDTQQLISIEPEEDGIHLFFQSTSVNVGDTWEAGDWVVNLDVTDGHSDLTVEEISICREAVSCDNTVDTIVVDDSMSTNLDGGVETWTLSGVETTGSDDDTVYITFRIANDHHMASRDLGITPDEVIESPIEEDVPFFDVDITGTNSPVGEGSIMEVYYEVFNSGSVTGEQDILLNILEDSVLAESGDYWWTFGEGSGTSLADEIGDADGTVHDLSWVSGDYEGGYALHADDEEQYAEMPNLDFFQTLDDPEYTIAFTVDNFTISDTFSRYMTGVEATNYSDGHFLIDTNANVAGDVRVRLRDIDDNRTRYGIESVGLDDGGKHRIAVGQDAPGPDNISIFVDGTYYPPDEETEDEGSSNFPSIEDPWLFFHQDLGSVDERTFMGTIDNPSIYPFKFDSDDATEDFEDQEWS